MTSGPARNASRTALRWENARSRSRQTILEAASTVFAHYGFENATMNRIAEGCGITKATIYAYFRDKESLYRVVMDGHLEGLPAADLDLPDNATTAEALQRIMKGMARLAAHPGCRAFCQALERSGHDRSIYFARWETVLHPFLALAARTFADAPPQLKMWNDGETFVRLVAEEHGLPRGPSPMFRRGMTEALVVQACPLR